MKSNRILRDNLPHTSSRAYNALMLPQLTVINPFTVIAHFCSLFSLISIKFNVSSMGRSLTSLLCRLALVGVSKAVDL